MKLVKLLLLSTILVLLVSPNLHAQSESIFEIVDIEVLKLNEKDKDKVDKLKKNDKILKYQGIKLKNLIPLIRNSNRKLSISIPDAGEKQLTATDIKYVDNDNYSWQGDFEENFGFALIICNEGKVFGFISYENRTFEIKEFEKNKHILQEYDMELMSNSLDTGDPPPIENPNDPPSGGGEDMMVVRLLIMYTPAADSVDTDIIQTAISARSLLNSALSASVPDVDIYVQHVATEELSFTEQKFLIDDDIDTLINNSFANDRRQYHQADIVVLLTNGDYEKSYGGGIYFDIYGCAGNFGGSFSDAYAIVEHDAASATYTLAHEVGHLLGGRHQNDSDATYNKGYAYTAGSWPNNKATLMHTMDPSKTRILGFSNPDVYDSDDPSVATGVSNSYDNARKIENLIDVVANYYTNLDDLNASISGPSNGNTYTNYTWQANVTGGVSPYSYFWEYSINGVDYVGALGTTQSITTTFPYNGDFTLRVRVTSADYQVDYGFLNVHKDTYGPVNGSKSDSNPQFKTVATEIENQSYAPNQQIKDFKIYPNPTTQASQISYNLTQASNVKLQIKDIAGRTVKELLNGYCNAGNQSYNLQIGDIRPGIYFVLLESGDYSSYKKITVIQQ